MKINVENFNIKQIADSGECFRWNKIEEKYQISPEDAKDLIYRGLDEGIHTSEGCGLKIIMNKNFIISAEAAKALDARDGDNLKVYIGFNYLF